MVIPNRAPWHSIRDPLMQNYVFEPVHTSGKFFNSLSTGLRPSPRILPTGEAPAKTFLRSQHPLPWALGHGMIRPPVPRVRTWV